MAGHGHIPYWLRVVFAQVFVAGVLLPTAAPAQTGYYLTPSLSVAEVYDDNVFFTPSPRTHDFLTRISPGLKAAYQSAPLTVEEGYSKASSQPAPLTVEGGYSFDSEIYSQHQELTTPQMRQRGSLEVKVMPDPVLTLSVSGAYYQTKTPTELNLTTGLAARRVLAERYTASPGFTYRFDPLTTVKGDYTFSKDLLAGGITIDSHIENLALDYRLSPRDTAGPGYVGRQFAFAGFPALTSHAFTLDWSHELTPLTTFTLRGGPRVTEGTIDRLPEALASIRHTMKNGELSLSYASTLTTVIGQSAAAMAQGITGKATTELLPKLVLSAGPAIYRVSSDAFKATVYSVVLEASHQLTKALALQASYQYSFQRGSFNPQTGPTGPTTVEILHNIFLIRLTVTYPARVD
jgi:hypothetical protein